MLKSMVLAVLLAGAMHLAAPIPQPAWRIDLQSRGWQADRGVLHGSTLPHTVDFADDDSLWVAFPTEASKSPHTWDYSARYGGRVLHIAAGGEIIRECEIGAQQWSYLRLFAQRSDGFTLDSGGKLVAYDGQCKLRATYPTDARAETRPSPNRALIYLRASDSHVRVLDGSSLQVLKEFDVPADWPRDRVLFGDHVLLIATTIPTRGCWQSQFSRLEVTTGRVTPWVTIDCARFNVLADGHVVYTSMTGDDPLEIVGDSGIPTAMYKPRRGTYLDRGVLEDTPVASPQSLRVVAELIKARGRYPALDMDGKFVGRDIVLLDMHTGTAVLTLEVPMSTQTYAYALSRDGKKLAVLLNTQLSVYRVP
jgi:hypothetical protein